MRSKLPILLLAFASACAAPRYLARVDDAEITGADLKREFRRRHAGHESFLADERSIRSFVERIIDHRLLVLEAYRLGLDDDAQLKAAVERYRNARLLEHMAKVELDGKVQVSQEEIQAIYDAKLQEVLDARQLVVPSKDEAEALRAQASTGADFETLVRERSTAPSRKRGGFLELGWGSLPPEREAIVFALADGGVSPVMETPDGFEIIQVISRRKLEKKPDFGAAAGRIKNILETRQRDALKRNLAAALWAKYGAKLEPFEDTADALEAAEKATPPSTARAASWSGGEILVRDLAAALKLDVLRALPPETARREVRNALENMVDPELLALEAKARGYADLPEIAEQVNGYRDALVGNHFEAEFLVKGVEATDDEVRAYYEEHKAKLVAPEERKIAHIVVEKPETAAEVEKKLAAGESFEELARTYSKDAETAKRGGTLAWVKPTEASGELAVVFDLGEGAVSKPVKTSFGHHVFKVLEIKPERQQAFEEVEPECRLKALQAKRDAKRADWVKRLRATSKIVVSAEGIRQFVKENPVSEKVQAKSMSHAMGGKRAPAASPAGAPAAAPAPAPADAPAAAPAQTAPATPGGDGKGPAAAQAAPVPAN